MNKAEELAKLDRAIKDAETRIKTVQTNIDALNKELDVLSSLESTLSENVKCLKKKQIVAMAQEFKRVKEELKKTNTRITLLKNDREHFLKSSKDMEEFIHKTKEEIKKIEGDDNNVLNFRNKKK